MAVERKQIPPIGLVFNMPGEVTPGTPEAPKPSELLSGLTLLPSQPPAPDSQPASAPEPTPDKQ